MNECNARGDLLARIYVPYWCQASPNFVLLGLFFLATLQADTVNVAQLAHNTSASQRLISDFALLMMPIKLPSNMRIFPKEERFSQHTFERSCRKNPHITLPKEETALAAVTNCQRLVRVWFVVWPHFYLWNSAPVQLHHCLVLYAYMSLA
jgi:hypothetical protein